MGNIKIYLKGKSDGFVSYVSKLRKAVPSLSRGGDDSRHILINDPQQEKFSKNAIATGKYNIFTFVPYFLFSQFKRAANVFFLVISILQQVPNVSPTGQWTTLGPLMFILSISALREIAEDYRRQRDDDQTNNKLTKVVKDGLLQKCKWKDVTVGSILKIESGKQFPADLILLASSEPKGMAYIETSNLDGETNLKLKQALKETSDCTSDEEISRLKGICEAEAPTKHLYEFYGNVQLGEESNQTHPLDQVQLLLRGSQLRNTKFVYGLVIYTGAETKLMKNSRQAPLKQSNVEFSVNYQILYMFFALLALSIISTIGKIYNAKFLCVHWYLDGIYDVQPINGTSYDPNSSDPICEALDAAGVVKTLMTFLILYNNVVPISLLISIEIVKYVQAIFINQDELMEWNNTKAKARTSNLNEELGQISYIFTDKTGTLTENVMEFKKFSVGGELFSAEDMNLPLDENIKAIQDKIDFVRESDSSGSEIKTDLDRFLQMLAVCQTVVPEYTDENELEYQASSPDEAALVKAAAKLKYVFKSRTPDSMDVKERGELKTYALLHVLEFTSARKRMSVVVETPEGQLFLFCKGADNVIYERLQAAAEGSREFEVQKTTEDHLEKFATAGLRTLCFAFCELDREFYERWRTKELEPASTSIVDREAALEIAYSKIEKDLILVGASAVEDKLQQQVPETIAKLRQAGISIWMLTGDKQETAVNIGFSCRLIDQTQQLYDLDCDSLESTKQRLNSIKEEVEPLIEQGKPIAMIITGRTMKFVFKQTTRDFFMHLAVNCKSVICCRVSPSQKADIVKAVKKEVKKSITLAIGDGANDVPMIQSAHIGIGISGNEGLQAANSSDYSISQFMFLQRLLLVHGAWNYWRLVKCILFSFYKNITLYMIELWFAIYNGWSGQILFDRWSISCYNVLFTFWPPITVGWFERPCEDKLMLKKPQLYATSQSSMKFNGEVFWKMFFNAIVHSCLLFFITVACFSDDLLNHGAEPNGLAMESVNSFSGQVGGYLFIGNFVYTNVVVTVLLKISLETSTWTFWNWLSNVGSGFLWLMYVLMLSKFWPSVRVLSPEMMAGQGDHIFSSAVFWFSALLVPFIVISRDFLYKVYRYETAADNTFKRERHQDGERITFKKFFNQTKENIEHMALICRKAPTLPMEMSAEPSAAPIIDRDGQKSSFKGYAFSQMEDNIGIQEDIIRHNLPKSKESSTTQVNQLNPSHEPVPTSAVLYVRKET